MPRSSVLLTPDPVDAEAVARAVSAVHARTDATAEPFELRALDDGAVLQVLAGDVVVLSVLRPRLVPTAAEVIRILPGVATPPAARWWTEAYTPWHPGGAIGISVLDTVAEASAGLAVHHGLAAPPRQFTNGIDIG